MSKIIKFKRQTSLVEHLSSEAQIKQEMELQAWKRKEDWSPLPSNSPLTFSHFSWNNSPCLKEMNWKFYQLGSCLSPMNAAFFQAWLKPYPCLTGCTRLGIIQLHGRETQSSHQLSVMGEREMLLVHCRKISINLKTRERTRNAKLARTKVTTLQGCRLFSFLFSLLFFPAFLQMSLLCFLFLLQTSFFSYLP